MQEFATMLQAFVITLREGLEAFLIVGHQPRVPAQERPPRTGHGRPLGHPRRRRRQRRRRLSPLSTPPIRNGSKVRWRSWPPCRWPPLTIHMWRAGRRMKGDIEAACERRAQRAGAGGVCRRVAVHAADDQPRRHGNGAAAAAARQTLEPGAGRRRRGGRRGVRGLVVVALRPPRQPGAFLPGDRDLSVRLRRAALHPGVHEMSEQNFLPVQRAHSRGHRIVGTRQPLRPPADLPARRSCRSAGSCS